NGKSGNTYVGDMSGAGKDDSTATSTGLYNSFFGYYAGWAHKSGDNNTYLGCAAGRNNETGVNNVYVGCDAGYSSKTGSGNVFLGYCAGRNADVNNKLYIANSSSTPLIWGDFSTRQLAIRTTNANDFNFYVYGSAGGSYAWNTTSDKRLKTNIKPLQGALQSVLKLQGVTFNWKDETDYRPGQNIGFIAQDVKEIFPEIVSGGGKDEEGNEIYYSIEYATLTPVLVEAIKEQQKIINELIEELKAVKEQLKNK
ncbi:MAG TPA: tail fiber domain-containing protein, partial [Salinivirgaceae bacterium]|nr:tail fiber domain-containing protein [Salinivirgaceae bacterium]